MDKTEIKARLDFRKRAIDKLREAYIALIDGGVKSYAIEGRELTRLDLPALKKEIDETEKEIDELSAQLSARRPRKVFGIVPRDR